MNLIERAVRRVDAAQQRHKVAAFACGIVKKYGDDNGVPTRKLVPGAVAGGRAGCHGRQFRYRRAAGITGYPPGPPRNGSQHCSRG